MSYLRNAAQAAAEAINAALAAKGVVLPQSAPPVPVPSRGLDPAAIKAAAAAAAAAISGQMPAPGSMEEQVDINHHPNRATLTMSRFHDEVSIFLKHSKRALTASSAVYRSTELRFPTSGLPRHRRDSAVRRSISPYHDGGRAGDAPSTPYRRGRHRG